MELIQPSQLKDTHRLLRQAMDNRVMALTGSLPTLVTHRHRPLPLMVRQLMLLLMDSLLLVTLLQQHPRPIASLYRPMEQLVMTAALQLQPPPRLHMLHPLLMEPSRHTHLMDSSLQLLLQQDLKMEASQQIQASLHQVQPRMHSPTWVTVRAATAIPRSQPATQCNK